MKLEYKWHCPVCDAILKTRELLYQHQQEFKHYIHVPAKESVCPICSEIFKNELNNIPKDSSGKYNHSILSENIWNERKEKILSCGIDLMKFGWVSKVKQLTGLTQRELENTLEHFNTEFEGKYFRRKN